MELAKIMKKQAERNQEFCIKDHQETVIKQMIVLGGF